MNEKFEATFSEQAVALLVELFQTDVWKGCQSLLNTPTLHEVIEQQREGAVVRFIF